MTYNNIHMCIIYIIYNIVITTVYSLVKYVRQKSTASNLLSNNNYYSVINDVSTIVSEFSLRQQNYERNAFAKTINYGLFISL